MNFQVACFPFDDHNCPPLQLIYAFCQSAYDWLKGDLENVVVVHCKAGMARTGLMICCLLLYLKVKWVFKDFESSLKTVGSKLVLNDLKNFWFTGLGMELIEILGEGASWTWAGISSFIQEWLYVFWLTEKKTALSAVVFSNLWGVNFLLQSEAVRRRQRSSTSKSTRESFLHTPRVWILLRLIDLNNFLLHVDTQFYHSWRLGFLQLLFIQLARLSVLFAWLKRYTLFHVVCIHLVEGYCFVLYCRVLKSELLFAAICEILRTCTSGLWRGDANRSKVSTLCFELLSRVKLW